MPPVGRFVDPRSATFRSLSVLATYFFNNRPAPPGPPDVFLLRWILQDWFDEYATQVLKKLHMAAVPGKAVLIIVET